MKFLVVCMFLGAFHLNFNPGCEALKYQGFAKDDESGSKFVDVKNHVRSRRSMNGSEASCTNGNCTEQINHRYYVSKVISDGQRYWRDIEGHPNSTTHPNLSNQFLRRQQLLLSFKFPYYGHYLDRVVLTTGGFLYMDVHDTSLITEVQYLAPLMAYFNPSLSVNSTVLTLDDGEQLTVQWRNILLHNKTNVGPFNFQCTLHKNGTIWFAYKQVPVSVDSLPDLNYHPVRVGISDAFVILRRDPVRSIVYRFFFIYSQVNITKKSVISGSAVVFYPLPSCVLGDSCPECMKLGQTTEFKCQWCPTTKRCFDGGDRNGTEWEIKGCISVSVKNISDERCVEGGMSTSLPPSSPTTTGCVLGNSCPECMNLDQTTDFNCQWSSTTKRCFDRTDLSRTEWEIKGCNSVSVKNNSDEKSVEEGMSTSLPQSTPMTTGVSGKVAAAKQRQSKGGIGAGAIVAIFIVLILICCVGAWCVYAYRHPTSKSGLFLIDISRRPRELFKSGSVGVEKTGGVAPSNVKLQVL
ncbi:PREDICTED: plexin domain-containing protein 2-like isoform X2 [Acropora digitifera]|uniref:plexin domain-containing protein 2-like isoform X2 n=1 Tax=Acropora digitifera TaxID=70779 RepID=UPI00077A410F|nr:PREDICTED: plexin domain-containing protein 2-like isoform X2 [Acropora digitifera]